MVQAFYYFSPTTPGNPSWTVDLGNTTVRLGREPGFVQEAELGAVGIGSLALDDVAGTLGHDGDAIVGLKQFYATESLAPAGNQRIFGGYIADRRYFRGTEAGASSLITGAARIIDMTLVDINSFLSFRVFQPVDVDPTSSFVRPAETDVERVTAMLTDVDFLSTTLFDGLVSSLSPVNMDEVDYTGQRPVDVLNDCAQQSGKNFFVFYDEAGTYTPSAGDYGLFYDFNGSLVYPAVMSVSNVLADRNDTTVFSPNMDATLVRDPSRVISGVLFLNGSNSVYRKNLTTSYTYGYRDAMGDTANLKTVAQITARADRYLSENATEDDRLTWTCKQPAAYVNSCLPGQYLPVKFTHLPGYESYTNVRVLQRIVAQDEMDDTHYNIRYEATPISVNSASCATALSAITSDQNTGTSSAAQGSTINTTVSITPGTSDPILLYTIAATVSGDTPEDHAMTTPTSFAFINGIVGTTGAPGDPDYTYRGVMPFVTAYRSISAPSGTYSAAGTYVKGFGNTEWGAFLLAIKTSATSPVQQSLLKQSTTAGLADAVFGSPPTPGNLIVAVASVQRVNTITPAESGWTQLEDVHLAQPGDATRNKQVTCWVRCYSAGDGQTSDGITWRFEWSNNQASVVSLSEWAIT